MIVYDFLVNVIIPLFVDLTKFDNGEKIFFYFYVAVLTGTLVIMFIYIPFKLIWNILSKATNNKKNTYFDLW